MTYLDKRMILAVLTICAVIALSSETIEACPDRELRGGDQRSRALIEPCNSKKSKKSKKS